MLLSPHSHLGPYEILSPLGAGGMGEVYRARDTRLGREVAIKVLRTDAARNEEWRRRFEREARAASSLNHPNILTVHDVGESDGAMYIVTELVEGESLRNTLGEGSLATRKFLDIAVQVADGLAAAHQAGITHRDLKPENIMITREGRVKILDFGLAKAAAPAVESEETQTVTELVTSPGVIVGTLAYMSPEQARGKPVDFRTDQFSFGSIVYEMATGKRPFQGKDRVETLSAIVKEEPPPVVSLNAQVPAPIRWVIDRCLAKEPGGRYASTTDLHQQLRDLRDHLTELTTSGVSAAPVEAPARRRRWAPALLPIAGGGIGFVLAAVLLTPSRPGPAAYRYRPLATEAVNETQPAWSPDGQSIAYVAEVQGTRQIFARSLNSAVPVQLTRSAAPCSSPFWSPDGTRIFYLAQNSIWSVGAAGGAPLEGVRDVTNQATISADGKTLAFYRYTAQPERTGLWFSPVSGGEPREYKQAPFPEHFRYGRGLQFSPDGRKLLAGVVRDVGAVGWELWLIPFPGGEPRLVPGSTQAAGGSYAFSWMPDSRTVARSASVLGSDLFESHIEALDTETGRIETITSSVGEEVDPAVSPDGKSIAFVSGGANWDLVEGSLDRGETSPLLATSRNESSPAWAPSGRQYVYVSDSSGLPEIWLRDSEEGSARPVVIGDIEGRLARSRPRLAPDGQRIAFVRIGEKHLVWIANLAGGRAVTLEQETTDQHGVAWSPDGNWIAYARIVGNTWEIAKAPSGGGSRPVRLTDGGSPQSWLEWSGNGRWICYSDPQGLYVVSADGKLKRQILKGDHQCWGLSKDSASVYVVRKSENRQWELASVSVEGGMAKKVIELNLPREAEVNGFSLHPNGKRFILGVGVSKHDIWLLEGFRARGGPFGWLRRGGGR